MRNPTSPRPARPNRTALALLAATALSACNLAPKHVTPALSTPVEYPPEVTPSGGSISATAIGWQDYFKDPRLRELIRMALENNRDLRVSVARIEEARGQYRIQRADQLPQLGLTGSATRRRTGIASIQSQTGGATNVPTDGGANTPDGFTFNTYNVGVAVTAFELDFWGRVANLSEAARANYFSTIAAERAFRLSLIRDLATAYLTSRSLSEQADLADRTIASRRTGLKIARLRLDAGVTSALDYRQAEVLLTQAETEAASLRNQRAQQRNIVRLLVGQPIDEDLLAPAATLDAQGLVRDIAAGLPSELLANRPDILQAEEDLRAARANIGAARAAFFPSITLTGNAGFTSSALGNLVGKEGLGWSIGPSLTLPIFDWGARKGDLTVARARETIAVATYERTVQTAFREVADALAGRRYLREQIEAQVRAVDAQRTLARLAESRYQNGVAQYLEVLDAQRSLFAAEQTLIVLRGNDLQNLVTLYTALGGGLGPPPPLRPGDAAPAAG
ncbi:MAG TPA: efflux transporter outer membrane subunit [Sphingomonas sp.]|jgi:multidrug efflux system outer membrane protein|uniref:efflux transporter outer membrane subunit n=1 Tax=Sphingomonas sp. TaxID=28214 RepID=UPI002ED814A0